MDGSFASLIAKLIFTSKIFIDLVHIIAKYFLVDMAPPMGFSQGTAAKNQTNNRHKNCDSADN